MRSGGFLLACAVVIAANAVALLGVARNRSGTPSQTIELTERELALSYQRQEDSGVSVRFDWNRYPIIENAWLDRQKLEGLGIDYAGALRDPSHYRQLPRPAFIVLEYDGPAWQQRLQSLEQSKTVVKVEPNAYSRLVLIDAGRTPELLDRYADRQKYLIVRGLIEVHVTDWDPKTLKRGPARLQPSFSIFTGSIHIPLPLSSVLASLPYRANQSAPPRYSVVLTFGSRFEPWVVAVKK